MTFFGSAVTKKFDVDFYIYFLLKKWAEANTNAEFMEKHMLYKGWINLRNKKKSRIDSEVYLDEDDEIQNEQIYIYMYWDDLEDYIEQCRVFYLRHQTNPAGDALFWEIIKYLETIHKHLKLNQLDHNFYLTEMLTLEESNIPLFNQVDFFKYMIDGIEGYFIFLDRLNTMENYWFDFEWKDFPRDMREMWGELKADVIKLFKFLKIIK